MKSVTCEYGCQNPQEGITSGVAYDTAWTARVTDERGNPVFPECVKWLLENQKSDGSWGSYVVNYHDRILSTLNAVITLKMHKKYESYIRKGEQYIWENIKNLRVDPYRLIGSELLLPSLMRQAESMGLNLPYHTNIYEKEYHMKLKKIDESLWYSPLTTLSFSLEFLGDAVDVDKLQSAQLPNGSVATSPAATAFLLQHTRNIKAFLYLKKILSLTGDGSIMTVYPIEVFEYGWALYNLMLAGIYFERYTEICNFLMQSLGPKGVGWSVELPIADADDTALACKALHTHGYPVDFRVFDSYDTGEHYLAFAYELNPSVSTNIHVLDIAKDCPAFPQREKVIERLIHFLKKEMNPEGFWLDKWHMSPYYTTAHAVITLCDVEPALAEKAVSWIQKTQNENGLWGENGTLEETAYAIQAILYYHQTVERLDISTITLPRPGHGLPLVNTLPDLWIGKVLYTPVNVIYATVASAQTMLQADRTPVTQQRGESYGKPFG